MDFRRQDKARKQTIGAQRIDHRLALDAGEHRITRIFGRTDTFGAQPVHTPTGHGARQHEHRQPGRVFSQVGQIGRDAHGDASQQAAVARYGLETGRAGFVGG